MQLHKNEQLNRQILMTCVHQLFGRAITPEEMSIELDIVGKELLRLGAGLKVGAVGFALGRGLNVIICPSFSQSK